MLAPVPDIGDAEERFVVAGVEYGDGEYVWIGQAKLTTVVTASVRLPVE